MGIFNDLPAPSVSKAVSSDAFQLDAQLERLKHAPDDGDAVLVRGHGDDAAEEDEQEEDEEEQMPEPPQTDLRRRPRPREDDEEEQAELPARGQQHASASSSHAADSHAQARTGPAPHAQHQPQSEEHQQQRKRVRINDATEVHEAPAPKPLQADEVSAALRRIASHISNPAKFTKACPLLRQLLDGESVRKGLHQSELLQAIRAAFLDPATCAEALLRREYMKLIASIASRPDLFGKPEKAHLDIYRLVGHVQNELATDDSFVFNKALGRIKEALEELSEVEPEDDAVLSALCDRGQGNPWAAPGTAHSGEEGQYEEQVRRLKQEHAKQVRRWEEEERRAQELEEQQQEEGQAAETDDPFGLDTLMATERQARRPPPKLSLPPPPIPTTAWSAVETSCMRREAVLQCLRTCQAYHKNAWARTGVELLIEQCYESRARFCSSQQPALEELMTWVKQQRAARKQGPSAKEINRDSTAFERARAEWGKATVSARGKVGGGGDAKANNWLG